MRKLLAIAGLLLAMALPALAQRPRLSPDDQQRFDSYYSRWLEYKRTDNRDQIVSMEKRMQDIYAHYNIPPAVPYSHIASGGDRDDDHWRDSDHDRVRDHDSDQHRRDERAWSERLSSRDHRRFDSYYSRWLKYRETNDRDQIASMEKRMFDIYHTYGIPDRVPFDDVASHR